MINQHRGRSIELYIYDNDDEFFVAVSQPLFVVVLVEVSSARV